MTSEAVAEPVPGDVARLERAVELGRRGWGRVHPNPMVGCVLVKDGFVVAEGWHEEYGGPHAEMNALERAGASARGATAFVSLEPCDHHGQTPPCSEGLIAGGITRVVYGAADPGTRSGGGNRRLLAHGVEVIGPCFDGERAHDENPVFFHTTHGRGVYLALKLAVSRNGMIAAAPGERTQITGEEAAAEVHRLRAGFDAILIGAETALVDDPRLIVRGVVRPRVSPVRVVFDSRGRLRPDARLFSDPDPVIVVTSPAAPSEWCEALRSVGATLRVVVGQKEGGVDIEQALDVLHAEGIRSILCEGGATLATGLIEAERVQRFYLFQAPQSLEDVGVRAFLDRERTNRWLNAAQNAEAPRGWRLIESGTFGQDRLTVWSRFHG